MPTPFSIQDLDAAEWLEMQSWQARTAGTAQGTAYVKAFSSAWSIVSPQDDAPLLNRVWFADGACATDLESIEAHFAAHGRVPQFDVIPHPKLHQEALSMLHQHGYMHTGFKSVLAVQGVARDADFQLPQPVAGGVLVALEPRHYDAVLGLYGLAFNIAPQQNPLRYHGFRQHLAQVGAVRVFGVLAATVGVVAFAVCYDAEFAQGAQYAGTLLATAAVHPDYRGRGYQVALTQARIQTTPNLEKRLFSAQCAPFSASQRNLERAGLRLVATKAIWQKGDGMRA